MVGVSKDFFEGLISGGFSPYNLWASFARVFRTETCTFHSLSAIHSSSCIACFFPAPLFFVCTVGLSYLTIIISLIEGRSLLCFFCPFPIPSGLFTVYLPALLYLVYISSFLVRYILWVHTGSFSCISLLLLVGGEGDGIT